MSDKDPKGELYPRHTKALARAIREAEGWRGLLTCTGDDADLVEFDAFIDAAKQAMREVREVAKQHGCARKYAPWKRLVK